MKEVSKPKTKSFPAIPIVKRKVGRKKIPSPLCPRCKSSNTFSSGNRWRCRNCGRAWLKNPVPKIPLNLSRADSKWLATILDRGAWIELGILYKGKSRNWKYWGKLQVCVRNSSVAKKIGRLLRVKVYQHSSGCKSYCVTVVAKHKLKEIAQKTLPYLTNPKQQRRMRAIIKTP